MSHQIFQEIKKSLQTVKRPTDHLPKQKKNAKVTKINSFREIQEFVQPIKETYNQLKKKKQAAMKRITIGIIRN